MWRSIASSLQQQQQQKSTSVSLSASSSPSSSSLAPTTSTSLTSELTTATVALKQQKQQSQQHCDSNNHDNDSDTTVFGDQNHILSSTSNRNRTRSCIVNIHDERRRQKCGFYNKYKTIIQQPTTTTPTTTTPTTTTPTTTTILYSSTNDISNGNLQSILNSNYNSSCCLYTTTTTIFEIDISLNRDIILQPNKFLQLLTLLATKTTSTSSTTASTTTSTTTSTLGSFSFCNNNESNNNSSSQNNNNINSNNNSNYSIETLAMKHTNITINEIKILITFLPTNNSNTINYNHQYHQQLQNQQEIEDEHQEDVTASSFSTPAVAVAGMMQNFQFPFIRIPMLTTTTTTTAKATPQPPIVRPCTTGFENYNNSSLQLSSLTTIVLSGNRTIGIKGIILLLDSLVYNTTIQSLYIDRTFEILQQHVQPNTTKNYSRSSSTSTTTVSSHQRKNLSDWNKLAHVLQKLGETNTTLQLLDLSDNQLSRLDSTRSMSTSRLISNSTCCISYLSKGIQSNLFTTITTLNLYCNNLQDYGVKDLISTIVYCNHCQIRSLDLGRNNLTYDSIHSLFSYYKTANNTFDTVDEYKTSKLQILKLHENNINTNGIRCIVQSLQYNTYLQELDISSNTSTSTTVLSNAFICLDLFYSLQFNTTLKKINIQINLRTPSATTTTTTAATARTTTTSSTVQQKSLSTATVPTTTTTTTTTASQPSISQSISRSLLNDIDDTVMYIDPMSINVVQDYLYNDTNDNLERLNKYMYDYMITILHNFNDTIEDIVCFDNHIQIQDYLQQNKLKIRTAQYKCIHRYYTFHWLLNNNTIHT